MTLGFEAAGFDVKVAVELDPIHAAVHALNFPTSKTICEDVTNLTSEVLLTHIKEHEVDIIFGGPPCQGFSLIGKRQRDDPRNLLISEFMRVVKEVKPKYFVMENVEGLIRGSSVEYLRTIIDDIRQAGYDVVDPIKVLNAKDYGIPQNRKRIFVIGYRKGLSAPQYPVGTGVTTSVWDAISDMPDVEQYEYLLHSDIYLGNLKRNPSKYAMLLREDIDRSMFKSGIDSIAGISGCRRTNHSTSVIGRFENTAQGACEPISRYFRLPINGVSNTLRAGTGASHGSYTAPRPIHPILPRCITVREAARIHSFPDWFQFHHTIWHGFREIGNSVPPILSNAVAKEIMKVLY